MRISDWSSDVCSSDLLASEIVERALDMRREQMLGRRGIAVEPRFDELTMLEIGAILAARGLEMRDHIAFRHHLESLDQLRDRKRVVEGKSVSVRVDLGGRRIL